VFGMDSCQEHYSKSNMYGKAIQKYFHVYICFCSHCYECCMVDNSM